MATCHWGQSSRRLVPLFIKCHLITNYSILLTDGNLTLGTVVKAPCAAVYMVADSESLFADECSEIQYEDHEERLAAIYQGLTRAILSDGKDTRRPRGELLLVGPEQKFSWWHIGAPFTLFEFTSAPGERYPSPYVVTLRVLHSVPYRSIQYHTMYSQSVVVAYRSPLHTFRVHLRIR
ncbi:hypothetical protein T492DRAFT_307237 [Pavlovales sp. CCMP2436]|nr:hypothetical protein T492DRAFT_307237 [Pavlovales sp. CCMP2436]